MGSIFTKDFCPWLRLFSWFSSYGPRFLPEPLPGSFGGWMRRFSSLLTMSGVSSGASRPMKWLT
jgi:hypothetical protein